MSSPATVSLPPTIARGHQHPGVAAVLADREKAAKAAEAVKVPLSVRDANTALRRSAADTKAIFAREEADMYLRAAGLRPNR